MATSSLTARVRAIKLLSFGYDRLFKAAEGTSIQFKVQITHHIPPKTTRLEILVAITYLKKNVKRPKPLLSAECLTVYQLSGVEAATEIDEKSGNSVVDIPEDIMQRMLTESISHARALLAAQTVGTAFGGTHIEVQTTFPIDNRVKL
ncbi:MAG: hypothetical protein ACRYFX_19825 [Janthinobacterium lividum]